MHVCVCIHFMSTSLVLYVYMCYRLCHRVCACVYVYECRCVFIFYVCVFYVCACACFCVCVTVYVLYVCANVFLSICLICVRVCVFLCQYSDTHHIYCWYVLSNNTIIDQTSRAYLLYIPIEQINHRELLNSFFYLLKVNPLFITKDL